MSKEYLSTKTKPISIIIPIYNEELFLPKILNALTKADGTFEILVVDAGSTDNSPAIINNYPCIRWIKCAQQNRARQMNIGAESAKYDLLYFLHADVIPHTNFYMLINKALVDGALGGFSYVFDEMCIGRRINAFFTRFRNPFIGGGDQSLFIKKQVFYDIGKFDESQVIMEDFDFVRRSKEKYKFVLLPEKIIVSARKYSNNSYCRVMYANFIAFSMFRLGMDAMRIKKFYQGALRNDN